MIKTNSYKVVPFVLTHPTSFKILHNLQVQQDSLEINTVIESSRPTNSIETNISSTSSIPRSPFYISDNERCKSASTRSLQSKHSFSSNSWGSVEATDPLLVRWQEYKMLHTTLEKKSKD